MKAGFTGLEVTNEALAGRERLAARADPCGPRSVLPDGSPIYFRIEFRRGDPPARKASANERLSEPSLDRARKIHIWRELLEHLRSRPATFQWGERGRNADKYAVLVRNEMAPGTRGALIAAGKTPNQIGQDPNSVHLKSERGWNTYGLRPGSVGVFNSRIVGSGRVDDW